MPSFFTGPLISERVITTGGRATGFDYMRFLLAVSVILFHTIITSYGRTVQDQVVNNGFGHGFKIILPMFFALSGFLVAGSLERSKSIGVFLGLRVFRIFPALAMDTLLCALLLGPLLTTLPLQEYFNHPVFHQYFLNILGIIHFELPGVFEGNPVALVNGQLWTIPVELECYITLTVLGLLSFHRRRHLMLAAFVAMLVLFEGSAIIRHNLPGVGRMLLLAFCSGVAFYQFREYIRLSVVGFVVALVLTVVCVVYKPLLYGVAIPATYMTVCLGLLNPPKWGFLETGDYSYGLFLYGFPLQQALMQLLPAARVWYINALLAVPLALVFSMLSWHLIEKRVLARKGILFSVDTWVREAASRALRLVVPRRGN